MKSILITWIAGTGKSAVCEELKNRGYKTFDIEKIDELFSIRNKATGEEINHYKNDNLEFINAHDWLCDIEKLQKLLKKNNKGTVFYCGTASNMDNLLPFFDKIFLLKVSLEILKSRLSDRRSNWFARDPKIQEWMFGWKEQWEEEMKWKGAVYIDADQELSGVAEEVLKKII